MIKSHLIASAALISVLTLGLSQTAQAQTSRIYLAGYLGLNLFKDQSFTESTSGRSGEFKLDNAPSFAGALGVRLSPQLRVEGEWYYRNADFTSVDIAGSGSFSAGGDVTSNVLFANMYYDFDVPWMVQPYVGGGIGYGWHSADIDDSSNLLRDVSTDDSNFMWNAALGLKYRPSSDFAVTAGYRYLDSFDLELDSYEIDYSSHEFRMGVEWDFPTR